MASSRQFLVRVTAAKADTQSPVESEDDEDEDYDLYGSMDTRGSGDSSNQREKILEFWWSLSRCKSGEFTGSYMVDAVIPNQM